MDASVKAGGAGQFSDDDEMDEEEGGVVESAPPLQLGEERVVGATGITKKLLKLGAGWETPQLGDEATVHKVIRLLDGTILSSTRNEGKRIILPLDKGFLIPRGLEQGIMSMKRGEIALFTFLGELDDVVDGFDHLPPNLVLIQFEIELLSWVSVVDVHKDGIIKRILDKGNKDGGKPGALDEVLVKYKVKIYDGTVVVQTPDEGIEFCVKDGHLCPALPLAIVTMHPGEKANLLVLPLFSYVAKLEDGTIFERKGFGESEPLVFVTDEEQVIYGLDKAAATMKKGEKAELSISPEYGYGNVEVQRDLAKVPQCSTLIYEVEMLDFVKEKKPWEMNNQEKIEAANRKKEEGNLLYKNQKYKRAAKKYDKAADCIENGTFDGDEEKQVKALRVSCFLNGAACSLKLKDLLETIRLCSKVLDIEFQNVKALYRRAQSFIETGDFISAEMDIKKALEADPENREVKSLHRTLKQSKAESNKRDAKLYANMFAPSKKLKLVEAEEEEMATNVD